MMIPTQKPKVVIFDVDKTITLSNSWYVLTEVLGADTSEHARLYTAYKSGSIDWKEMRDGLFAIWKKYHKVISKEDLLDLFFTIELRGDAVATINELQDLGYEVALISSSIDIFVETVAERLAIKHWYANSIFVFDDNENWIDFKYDKDEAGHKLRQLQSFMEERELTKDDVIVVGDGESDIEMFRAVPGVAVHSDLDHLNRMAWEQIKYLPKLTQLLQSLPDRKD
ncbi:MAG: HAD family hydrolase [Patescibacteria group bacterium]